MISFSFGKNWLSYLDQMSEDDVRHASDDIEEMLGAGFVRGKSVIDMGSGSGIHSLGFHRLGASSVSSFDLDPHSVAATRSLWERESRPGSWSVGSGSILDDAWTKSLGTFDLVYSWGVLHHTGDMWHAVDNAAALCKPGGTLWIALYTKGPEYPGHLALKQRYNRSGTAGKRLMEARFVSRLVYAQLRRLQSPFAWNKRTTRGMNTYIDIVDWLGGLPYEVASVDEVVVRLRPRGFSAERIIVHGEGSCSSYVLRRDGRESVMGGRAKP